MYISYLSIYDCAGSLLLCVGFFLFVVDRSYSIVAVHGLLIAVASLVDEHRLQVHRLHWLCHMDSVVVTPGL